MRIGRFVLLAFIVAAWRLASPDTAEQPVAKATTESPAPAAVAAPLPQGSEPAPSPELQRILALLAKRAELHNTLLYRFQCTEDLTRKLQRRPDSAYGGAAPESEVHERCGIVMERGKDGVARAAREALDREGKVKLNRKGQPVEAVLRREFNPIVKAVPHAQAGIFTARGQAELTFHLLSQARSDGPGYRIPCPEGAEAVEFMDRRPPELLDVCKAQASGQMCVDALNGEISAIVFYGLLREDNQCLWDRAAPFAMVEQGLVESKTGARFPSRVRTIYSVSSRDNAIYDQRYEDCGFTNVEIQESFGGVVGD